MAAAHIVLRDGLAAGKGAASRSVTFHLANGDSRAAHLEGERISVDFPAMPATRVDHAVEMEAALGARPRETWVAPFGYVAIFDDARHHCRDAAGHGPRVGLRSQRGDRHRAGRC